MGILDQLILPRALNPGPVSDFWYTPLGGLSAAGVNITADVALKISTVWACVNRYANTLGAMPLLMYRELPNEGKERATNHPLYELLHDAPNRWQTAMEWKELITGHSLLRGNAYNYLQQGPRGFVDQIVPLNPDRMEKIERLENGQVRYTYRQERGESRVFLDDEILRLPGFSSDGITGMSPLALMRDTLGLSVAAQGFRSGVLRRGATPSVVLSHPGELGQEASEQLQKEFETTYGGWGNAGKALVLEEGMTVTKLGMTMEDLQAAAFEGIQVEHIAQYFMMPLHMIGVMTKETSWGTGIEQLSIGFVIYSLLPWAKRWEQRIKKSLILAPQFFAEFLFSGLLRGSTKERYEAYAIARNWGWMSVNDIRRLENLNPIDGGDVYLQPLNMTPAGAGALTLPEAAETLGFRGEELARLNAGRVLRKEREAVLGAAKRFASEPGAFRSWAREFYASHAKFVAEQLCISPVSAADYCADQQAELLRDGMMAAQTWETDRAGLLVELARRT